MLVAAVTLARSLRSGRCFIFFGNSLIPDSCSILLGIMRPVVNRNVIKLNVKRANCTGEPRDAVATASSGKLLWLAVDTSCNGRSGLVRAAGANGGTAFYGRPNAHVWCRLLMAVAGAYCWWCGVTSFASSVPVRRRYKRGAWAWNRSSLVRFCCV